MKFMAWYLYLVHSNSRCILCNLFVSRHIFAWHIFKGSRESTIDPSVINTRLQVIKNVVLVFYLLSVLWYMNSSFLYYCTGRSV